MTQQVRTAGLVTIDVEPDNVWANTHSSSLENVRHLLIFHRLCQEYGVRPTYLVSWSVANDDNCAAILEEILRQGDCEIGIHPHLWETPPFMEKDKTDIAWVGTQYPTDILEAKLICLTRLITQKFGTPISHRAGRWGMDSRQVEMLTALGIRVDSSIIPGVDWSSTGICDHTKAPLHPYYMDTANILKPGVSDLLQVPCTIRPGFRLNGFEKKWPVSSVFKRIGLGPRWLRASPAMTTADMLSTCEWAKKRLPHFNLMSHSSEFMPGGSPYWKTESDVSGQFAVFRRIFSWWSSNGVVPKTLAEFALEFESGIAEKRKA